VLAFSATIGLGLSLGVVVERARRHEDGGRVSGGAEGGVVHTPPPIWPLAQRRKTLDHLLGGQTHLHQLPLDQRVVAVAGDAM